MEQRTQQLFNENILTEAAIRYGIQISDLSLLGGFESFVYEFTRDDQEFVLRLCHDSRRTPDLIQAEAEWINYLADHAVPAARAVPSVNGELVEIIGADKGSFLATAFEKAPGHPPRDEDWTPDLFQEMGRITGRMHGLAKDYAPSSPSTRRQQWYEDWGDFADQHASLVTPAVVEEFRANIDHLHTLPQDRDVYGLVHTDFHRGNFHVQDGRITLFDFDDCQYSFFADDIAMAIFYSVPFHLEQEAYRTEIRTFFLNFMTGYRQEHNLDPVGFDQLPYFFKARELGLVMAIHGHFGRDLIELDGWGSTFMARHNGCRANDVPFIDVDFSELARLYQ
jgi:amicoumacin kinase